MSPYQDYTSVHSCSLVDKGHLDINYIYAAIYLVNQQLEMSVRPRTFAGIAMSYVDIIAYGGMTARIGTVSP